LWSGKSVRSSTSVTGRIGRVRPKSAGNRPISKKSRKIPAERPSKYSADSTKSCCAEFP
jgi:hypothetical protein